MQLNSWVQGSGTLRVKIKGLAKNAGTSFSLILVYIVICMVFTILSPYFLTLKNFMNIGIYASIIGVMAAGATVAMLLGAIDMSQYSVATVSSIMGALLISKGYSLVLVIFAIILVGVLCGIINGVLVAYLKISAIIVTMGTMQIFRGIAFLITGGNTIMVESKPFGVIGKGFIFNTIPVPIVIVIAIFALTYYLLNMSNFGRKVFAVGGNEKASYLSGINVKKIQFGALVICAISSALGGIIITSQVGAAIPTTGVGSEMGILAAVILGGMSLAGGKGKVSGTIIGVLILATIQNGLTLLSVKSFYVMLINGVVLILAVLMDVIRSGALKKQ